MTGQLLQSLLAALEVFRPALTRPGFQNMLVIFVGWVLTNGTHAVTRALVETAVAGRRHHEAFHRFFSRGSWNPDDLAHQLLQWILRRVPDGKPLRVALDDTLAPKKGPRVFGIGSHLDAVRSTRRHRIFCFGHCWVVLAVLLPVPFSRRTWALPLVFRLYRNKKECKAKGSPYRKKTELAREMLDLFAGWVGERRVEAVADSAYCNDTVTRGLPASIVLVGAMRPDAVLTALPPKRRKKKSGRPPVRGRTLPKPSALARDGRHPWQTCTATLYGRKRQVRYKTFCAQWYRACATRLLRIVVVQVDQGTLGLRVFFSMDATMSVIQILESYSQRWAIEVCFRDLKQLLGFADSSARKRAAVERTAPFVGMIYTTLVLWFSERAWQNAAVPLRPWYPHKHGLSFSDLLRTSQRVLAPLDVLDPACIINNLRESTRPTARPRRRGVQRAA
jgi:hypothetical protein